MNKQFLFCQYNGSIGKEGSSAQRVRDFRERKEKMLQSNTEETGSLMLPSNKEVLQSNQQVTQEIFYSENNQMLQCNNEVTKR